jgi:hypothetical protein
LASLEEAAGRPSLLFVCQFQNCEYIYGALPVHVVPNFETRQPPTLPVRFFVLTSQFGAVRLTCTCHAHIVCVCVLRMQSAEVAVNLNLDHGLMVVFRHVVRYIFSDVSEETSICTERTNW